MTNDLFSLREEEIFRTLRELNDCDFVIIGGYAVNAYALPRFSVDCDLVIKDNNALKKIEKLLLKSGYKQQELNAEAQYLGSFSRYEKKLENDFTVSMDILIRVVTDRMTGATFSADWVFDNSAKKALKGKTITEELRVKIINRDALLVMKMVSCRSTDIRDVFMMLPNAKDKKWIKSEIALRYSLHDRVQRIVEKVTSSQFRDGLFGVYGSFDQKIFDKHKKAIITFLNE